MTKTTRVDLIQGRFEHTPLSRIGHVDLDITKHNYGD